MDRREFIKYSSYALALGVFSKGITIEAKASDEEEAIELSFEEAYADATEGAKKIIKNAKELKLNIPYAPENGLVVPIEVEVNYPMQEGKYIKEIHVLTTKNKVNKVVTANLSPDNAKAYLYVNAKLGSTQEMVILAKTNDDVVFEARQKVKVALGGCG